MHSTEWHSSWNHVNYFFSSLLLSCFLFSFVCQLLLLRIVASSQTLFLVPGPSCRGTRRGTSVSWSLWGCPTLAPPPKLCTTRDSSIKARLESFISTTMYVNISLDYLCWLERQSFVYKAEYWAPQHKETFSSFLVWTAFIPFWVLEEAQQNWRRIYTEAISLLCTVLSRILVAYLFSIFSGYGQWLRWWWGRVVQRLRPAVPRQQRHGFTHLQAQQKYWQGRLHRWPWVTHAKQVLIFFICFYDHLIQLFVIVW